MAPPAISSTTSTIVYGLHSHNRLYRLDLIAGNHSPITGPAKNFCRASYRVHLEFPPQRSNLNLQGQLQGFSRDNPQSFFTRQ